VQDVLRDAVDVALRYGEPADSRLVARSLYVSRRVACAAPDYLRRRGTPRTPQELAQHNCLTLHIGGKREVRWRFEGPAGRDGPPVEVRVEGDRSVDDGAIGREWALAGAGIVYKSNLDIAGPLRTGALVALLPDWLGQRYALNAILPSNRFVPARVRSLVDFMAAKFAGFAA
jgi:DNA-binding transcriptional LysR family regulator